VPEIVQPDPRQLSLRDLPVEHAGAALRVQRTAVGAAEDQAVVGEPDVPPPALHLRGRDPPPRMPEFIEARSYVLLFEPPEQPLSTQVVREDVGRESSTVRRLFVDGFSARLARRGDMPAETKKIVSPERSRLRYPGPGRT
jgi:hypothetical protein